LKSDKWIIVLSILAILIVSGQTLIVVAAYAADTTPYAAARREVPIQIKLVFIGVDQNLVNEQFMTWNNPRYRYQSYLIPGISTNVIFTLNYSYVFVDQTFENKFVSYLSSIARVEKHSNVMWNYTYFGIDDNLALNYTNFRITTLNTFYSADDAENWLIDHADEYNGLQTNGYTLIVADLSSKVPSVTPEQYQDLMKNGEVEATPHYYNKTFVDPDLGLVRNRRWMTSWGGNERLYYLDLSAGPSLVTSQLPIQLAASINNIDVHSVYGKTWLNQYVSSYVGGVVYNLFTPDFVYPINYAKEYRVKIMVIDNRTNPNNPRIEDTVDTDLIKNKLQEILSFSKVEVEADFAKVTDYPELTKLIVDSTVPSTQIPSIEPTKAVDAIPVYEWLMNEGQGHITDFFNVTRNMEQYDIPVFAFAFDDNCQFGFTFKENIYDHAEEDRTIWGVSLYDMVLISHSSRDFNRGDVPINEPKQAGKGYGFSNTIIHEVGHMIGLNHPFIYDPTEDFVSSVMAYYPYGSEFSQFDVDALQRGIADQFMIYASSTLSETPSTLLNNMAINSARNYLRDADEKYSQMNYTDAINSSYNAAMQAAQAKMLAPNFLTTYGILIGLAVGGVIGLAVGYFLWKKGAVVPSASPVWTQTSTTTPQYPCSTCNQTLTWVSEYQRWYCQNCKRYQ
jgi:hypothetical protein